MGALGGHLAFAPGTEKLDRVRRAVRRASLVLVAIPACSHTASRLAAAEAARLGKPLYALVFGGRGDLEDTLRRVSGEQASA